jgi:hypothetical protein
MAFDEFVRTLQAAFGLPVTGTATGYTHVLAFAAPKPRGKRGQFVKTGRPTKKSGPPPRIAKKLGRKPKG